MKASRIIAPALALVVLIGIFAVPTQAAAPQKGKPQQPPAKPQKPQMPKEIQAVIQEGLATRTGRQDIPFSFFKQLALPARDNSVLPVLCFRAKNGDLGYAPSISGNGLMEANLNIVVQLFQPGEDGAPKSKVFGKSSVVLSADSAGYDPAAEDWYSLSMGTALQPGNYTLALVLSTPDLKKISVGFAEVNLPGPEVFQTGLVLTDPVIASAIDQTEPDQRPTLHRGYFTWGALKVTSPMTGEIPSGSDLDTLFFVHGTTPQDPASGKLDLELNFEVQYEDGKPAIRWAPGGSNAYLVDQPLQLIQTIQKQDEKGTVLNTERKPLPAGKYALVVTVVDKVSGKKGEAKMAFSIK